MQLLLCLQNLNIERNINLNRKFKYRETVIYEMTCMMVLTKVLAGGFVLEIILGKQS